MEYVNLGRAGLKVSRICLGTLTFGSPEWNEWVLNEEQSRPIIKRALELGVNFFDTADWYSLGVSEEILGRALRDFASRHEVVIATKVYFPMGEGPNQRGLSRHHILHSIEGSLSRLGSDYVDLLQIHRWDSETPIEETLQALDDLVRAGKVRYIGASSMYAWQFAKSLYLADLRGWTRFVSMQNHYNLVYREEEREMLPLCAAEGIAVLPWSPLARGFLAGTWSKQQGGATRRAQRDKLLRERYKYESDLSILDQVVEIAHARGVAPAQIALAWLLHQHIVTAPILGTTKEQHLEEAVAALDIELTAEEIERMEQPYQPHPILGHS